jgi:hypothetical protein
MPPRRRCTNANLLPVPDAEAEALAAACRVTFRASGAQSLAPQCMTYDRRLHVFQYDWKLGKATGNETITAQVSYPPSSYLTTGSETITIVK